MIRNLKQLFAHHTGGAERPADAGAEHRLRLAAAALLIEMARADYEEDPEEIEQIGRLLQQHFELSLEETEELFELASREADTMTSYHPSIKVINEACDITDKAHILKLLWQIAYADGRIDKYESHLIRKIANLLYLPREQIVAAKRAAEQAPK